MLTTVSIVPKISRYYVLSEAGRETLQTLKQEWHALSAVLDSLLGKGSFLHNFIHSRKI